MEQTAAPPQPQPLSATTAATTATINTTTTTTHPDSVETSPRSRNNDCWAEENSLYPSNNGSTAAAAPGGSAKLRLMCSYGGHIVPRPHDKTLCYVGGDTRIVVVDRHTTLSDLTHRLAKTLLRSSISSTTASFTLKYQLPSEDLDSLISVTTDEDLENMIDEYERLNSSTDVNKSSRLRLFLFPSKPESVSSIGSLLESTNKSEDWFLNALNGTSSMFSDTSSVNCLLGLEDDVSIPAKKDANHKGVIGKHLRGNNSVQDIQSVPDSPMLETSSSFGSASSSPSLANLPPVRVNVDDQQKVGGGIEEQFSHISVHQQQIKHQEDVSFLTAPAPVPVVITGVPIVSKVAITDNPNRVLSQDEKSEQGYQLAYRKQQQQQQQQQYQHKQSIAFDLPSPDSVSSDGSITNPLSRRTPPVVYQDPVSQAQFSANNNNNRASEHIPSNIHDQNTRIQIQDSAYLISTPTTPTQGDQHQQHPQLHHQPQFIHTAIPPPQYIQHHPYPSGAVPSYYQMYPSHSQGQHHAPRPLDQHNFVYYMPPPNNQVPPPPSSLFTGARTVQPATKTESPAAMYRTASSGPGQQQQQRQLQHQPQYVGYPTPGGNFGYEFTDPSKHVYYATPQSASPSASAAQYQTMVSSLSVPSPVEAAASHLQTDNNLRTTSQP
ncbi:unnamed protein product [Lactuca virosa]|uniref:PB1 domain-containing protein n=1 Tax=Lactuca virosa TaxID=75947 RepID=A0AAU9PLL9_9ASTR|nr:unnamed protein product [Lactuca virosa]